MKTAAFLVVAMLSAVVGRADNADLLVNEDFAKASGLPTGWRADSKAWRVVDGQLRVDARRGMTRILTGEPDWRNYEIATTVTFDKVANPSRWAGVVFRSEGPGKTRWSQFCLRFQAKKRRGTEFAVRTAGGRWKVRATAAAKNDCKIGRPRKLRVVVRGSDVTTYVDGKPAARSHYCLERETGLVGLTADGCIARFDDFSVRRLPDTPSWREASLKCCEIVAHRGFSGIAPENTLSSIAGAIRAGATGSECDVRATKDGKIVAMHDASVNRTTNGKGKVAELTFSQVRRLDAGSWKHKKFVGERVPTLDEILAAHKGSGCTAVVEIKTTGISDEVIDAVRRARMTEQTAVIAFNEKVVREMKTLAPELPVAWLASKHLNGTPARQADWIARKAREYKTNMVDLNYGMLSREVIAELKRRNIVVWAWTVNDPLVMEALMRWGVDSITTDRPDVAAKLLKDGKPSKRKTAAHRRRLHRN